VDGVIDPHYIRTIDRYVDELARKNALIVHTGATPTLLREMATAAKTIGSLIEQAVMDHRHDMRSIEQDPRLHL
jgi:hypothetical protein